MGLLVQRRVFLGTIAALAAEGLTPSVGHASTVLREDLEAAPPIDSREAFMAWMRAYRGEDTRFLAARWERYQALLDTGDLWDQRDKRAFLMTPRQEFVLKRDLDRAYDPTFLDIGFGMTISGPKVVARMTSALAVPSGSKVLEIGTGSGYQAAYLANLTDNVRSIEIIRPLAERTRQLYDGMAERGYTDYAAIGTNYADGYYGWEEAAPFDRIIVTCGIDHIPPALLRQLKPGGAMVIPIGRAGRHHVLKITKETAPDGTVRLRQADVFQGQAVPFLPLTKLINGAIVGTHSALTS
jgi:protein-L-isoaspartate(D-aspartate) O-methyltransferase